MAVLHLDWIRKPFVLVSVYARQIMPIKGLTTINKQL